MRNGRLLAVFCIGLTVGAAQGATVYKDQASGVQIDIGGFFYGAAHLDSNAAANRPWVNLVTQDADRGMLSFEPYGTRTHFSVQATKPGVTAKGFLELDWGPVTSPRIRHAYVSFEMPALTVLVGQYWVPYLEVGPDTFNPQWLNREGNAYGRAPQLTLARAFGPLQLSATLTTAGGLGGSVQKGNGALGSYALEDGVAPAGLFQARYGFGKVAGVGFVVGGGSAEVAYKPGGATDTARPRLSTDTFYAELFGNGHFGPLSLVGKLFYSAGFGMGTGVGQTLVIAPDGSASAVTSFGGFASVRYAFLPELSASLYAGFDNPKNAIDGVNLPIDSNFDLGATVAMKVAPPDAVIALEVERVDTVNLTPTGSQHFVDYRPSIVGRYSF